jgi:peptidoglycan-N-acetylglucosamine deacetylase
MPTVCLTFDFDAISLWLGTFRMATPTPISRGEYAARVGLPRVLRLLASAGIPATFFVPGHTAETYPAAVRLIAAEGHEIGAHGYLHERLPTLGPEEEEQVLARATAVLTAVAGRRPAGFRSPAWDLTPRTVDLLLRQGYRYDSSMMADDFRPYRCRRGDLSETGGAFRFGEETPLIELPVAWELDDFPYFQYIPHPYYNGTALPDHAYQIWRQEFDYMVREAPDGIFTLTLHPEIIGRGPRVEMLGRLIQAMQASGARFLTASDAVDAWAEGAR